MKIFTKKIKKMIKECMLSGTNIFLKRIGYMAKPIGNDFKKINILDIEEFNSLVAPILQEKRTYLKEDRLYTLWQAVKQSLTLKGDIVEIGVFQGGSAKFIALVIKRYKKEKEITLHLFDTFEGMPDLQTFVDQREKGGFENTSIELVREYLSDFKNVKFYKGLVENNAYLIKDKSFSFIHIDVDIYNPCKFCLEFFGERLEPAGIIIADDYGFKTCPGIKKAVDEYIEKNFDKFYLFHLLTGQAMIVRVK